MKIISLSFLLLMTFNLSYGQDEDYYKSVDKRSKNYELENLPYLQSRFSAFYIEVSGGFRPIGYGTNGEDFDGFGKRVNSLNSFEQLNLGLNLSNDLFFEIGLLRLHNEFATLVHATNYNPQFVEGTLNTEYYLPLSLKKKLVSLNRITKDAAVNFGLSASALLFSQSNYSEFQSVDLQIFLKSHQLEKYFVTSTQKPSPIIIESELEIRGELGNRLNLAVFFGGLWKKQISFEQDFEILLMNQNQKNYRAFEKNLSLRFGLRLGLNSKKFYRYSSLI